jgi:hypothetical protein
MSYYFTRQLVKAIDKLREELLQSLKNQTDAINTSTEATKETKQVSLQSPLVVELQVPEAEKAERKTDTEKNYTLQKWLTVGTWCAFGAAIIYAGIAAVQLSDFEDGISISLMAARLARTQAIAAQVAAQAAESAAVTAKKTLLSQQKSFEIDQRPYVVSEQPSFTALPILPNTAIYANIHFKNIGRTPAKEFLGSIDLVSFEYGPKGKIGQIKLDRFFEAAFAKFRQRVARSKKEIDDSGSERDIAPGDDSWSTNRRPMQLSDSDMIPPKIGIYYFGLISYSDSFNNRYETEFCYFTFPKDTTWRICDIFNTIK